ncbi:serine/threonine-protein kinase [Streptomyces ossamyceticus]|uniref:non-specific serine/threonine protein kinase n=1 Tax=Streptomyces ossamyceticus TaxID=249581 RepID=A0ABV2V296_9ACTN
MVEPGRVLDRRYRLDEPLGRGAQGSVWLGRDLRLDCPVAVKVATPRGAGEPSAELHRQIARFRREAQAMARIRNRPHVAVIYDHGEDGDILYSVMEYIDGTPLSAHTGQGRHVTLEQTVRWTRHICDGLADAHDAGVIHRDIKPSNIVIDANGSAKVVDFGLAQLLNASSTRGPGWGTLHYAAPERLDGQPGTVRSDLYSLGCVVYEMITGWSPFGHHRDAAAIMWHHVSKVPDPPDDLRPGVPRPLGRLVMSMLEKAPDDRPADARTVARALQQIEYSSDDDTADPHVDTRHVAEIQQLERFIQRHAEGPRAADAEVLDARARHAELTGRSGDSRGAAALYQRLAQDCANLEPSDEDRAYEAYREASRWKQVPR